MSKLFFKKRQMVGLDIGQNNAKIMAIDHARSQVVGYGSVPLDATKMQSVSDITSHLTAQLDELLHKKIVGKLPSNHVLISVPAARTFTRSVTLPKTAVGNLGEAVMIEAEQYIPVGLDELYTDFEIIETNKDDIDVLLSAMPKLQVDTIMKVCQEIGLKPLLVEPSISSVARLVKKAEGADLATVIIDIGADNTDIAVLDKAIRVTGSINIGGHAMTQAVMKKFNVDHDAAHMLRTHNGLAVGPKQAALRKAIEPMLLRIIEETKKVIRYYTERLGKQTKLEQVIIVGGGSNVPGLGDFFTENMLMPARSGGPWQILKFGKLAPLSKQLRPQYITAIGLALVDEKDLWR